MTSCPPERLLLFDIDGTLLTSGGAGEQALKDAMHERFGVGEDFDGVTLAGATDAAIADLLLKKHGLPRTLENRASLLDAYLMHLATHLPRHRGRLLPGMPALLERLRNEPRCVLALLTGNLARGAQLKLSHYGVWDIFAFGAFADDHHDRNQLGPVARARAKERHGLEFPPDRIYVIGDTPRDIDCGKAFGAKTVAIATGSHPFEELAAHKPDFVFRDVSDTGAVLAALLG